LDETRRTATDDRRAELERLNADLADTMQRKLDLDQALKAGEAQRGELELAQRELTRAIAGFKREEVAGRSQVQQLEDKIRKLQQSRQEIEHRNDELTRRRDQLENTVQTLDQQRWQRVEEHNRAIGELTARREALSSEVEQLQKRVHELKTDRQDLDATVTRRRAEHQELQQSVPHLQAKREELQRESERLQSEVSNLAHQESALQERMKKLREEQTSLETTLNKKQEVQENVAGLRIAEQAIVNGGFSPEKRVRTTRRPGRACYRGTANRRFVDAGVSAAGLRHLSQAPVDELEQLNALQSHLRRCGLRFHRRVLYAFHTALKVNDISPLVVLAGISGTGKSALPRRYAEAMGMHFLNLAVQPRWDSPQDMFGFFNYLDGRYRATELGRALIQMDPYFDRDDRGWTPPENWRRIRCGSRCCWSCWTR
jgi:predicted  nucleic acid-binding Zn-ribbon protein